jgi:hypothetical protein
MPRTRRPTSTPPVERAAADFASKTAARLAKLTPEERMERLAAFTKIVERVEARATAARKRETRANRVTTRAR